MLDPLYELNQCAFNSQTGDHRQALIHAERAIQALEQEVMLLRTKIESATNEFRVSDSEKNLFLERTSLLSIAYYNKGCECEHMKKIIKAAQAFSRAVNLQSGHQGN
jgi:tetratricopeptide (TPR) repeat protein